MMTAHLEADIATLRTCFAAATFADGGLLIHLRSGDFFNLDAVGSAIWGAIVGNPTGEQVVAAAAGSLQVSLDEAGLLVAQAIAQARAVKDHPPAGGPRFYDDGNVLSLRNGPDAIYSFDRRSLVLSSSAELRAKPDDEVAAALRIVVPKIFGGWYPLALHASAARVVDRVVLFSGDSGAGKTTTARLLSEEVPDSRIICEDVVLLSERNGAMMIVDGAEEAIQSWMIEATAALVTRREVSVSVEPLQHNLRLLQERIPLHKIIFLDITRRGGQEWSFAPLKRSAALRRLFLNSFFHSSDATALRFHLAACCALANQLVAADALAIPGGLADIRRSSLLQIETIAS